LQNLLKVAKRHGLKPRGTAGRKKHKSRISNVATRKTAGVKGIYISAMIQPVPKLKKEMKSISRQVNLAITSPPATTEYLKWSDQPVKFSRTDHPRKVPRPDHSPMVLKAQIGGYDVGRVFMDTGSGINLIYVRTLRAMCISLENLKPTDCSFHGIVPEAANYPLGKIELDVCFGDSSNYRREKLEFEVMDWPSQYHANPGTPSICKIHGSTSLCISHTKHTRT
jgi:hypothetical protein